MPKKQKKLRSGFTTGAAAAAAVKAALFLLVHGEKKQAVTIPFLSEGSVDIPVFTLKEEKGRVVCSVIKDGGDDPDVTNKAEIGASVSIHEAPENQIVILGGKGVGKITKPGLEVPPGEAAINPGPVKMIRQAVSDVLTDPDSCHRVDIELFVPRGETLAKHTLNHRLGIVGGISILGTTGVVKPMSHDAYIATIKSSLSVARAAGVQTLFFTTGRRSERFAEGLFNSHPKEAFVQVGDFFGKSLELVSDMEFNHITFVVFFGKAVKMAQGVYHTHAAKSDLSLDELSRWSYEITNNSELSDKIKSANTAREAFFMLQDGYPDVIDDVCRKIVLSASSYALPHLELNSVILDFNGGVVAKSGPATRGIDL